MPAFEDLGDFLSPTLDLPVGGKTYKVPSPPARVGLRLMAGWAISAARADDTEPSARDIALVNADPSTSVDQDALGPVYDEMLADGVTMELLTHAAMTAFLWVVAGEQAARTYWVTPLGEVHRPLPEHPTTSHSTASESPIPSPASTTTTPSQTPTGTDSPTPN